LTDTNLISVIFLEFWKVDIYSMLGRLAKEDGSDLYLAAGAPPCAKFSGVLTPLQKEPFSSEDIKKIAYEVMNEDQQQEFEKLLEMNLAISPKGIGRFRINIFLQRNSISMVCRNIQTEIPNIDDLGLPEILKEVVEAKNGLVLFVGGTGSGKSTSLAALIDHRNKFKGGHIITIEDPVEYIHKHKKCIVNQREVGVDTLSFHDALKNTLRQAPDLILIGEIRDRETMEHCLAFAETGHLAISTLHANNANQALDRIINFFPEERRQQLLSDIGNNLRAIVSQRLVPTLDGKRCAAIEIMLGSHTIKQMIIKGQLDDLKETMGKSENIGMKTFDGALYDLVVQKKIAMEEAIKFADSANNLRLRLKLSGEIEVEEEESPTDLLMRGQAPAAKADEQSEEQESEEQVSMESLLAQGIPGAAPADPAENSAAEKSLPDNVTPLPTTDEAPQTPPSTAGLSLSMEADPGEEPPEPGDDEDDMGSMGMGRIG